MGEKKYCRNCVLPECKPDIWLNDNKVCNICNEYRKKGKNKPEDSHKFLETDLIKLLNKYKNKGKGKYNCIVMCSGGKDSTMSLYYMKKKYRMNPLAFTFDHGFENEEALQNIKNAVNILDVDWMYYKSGFMKDIFAEIIKKKSRTSICYICALWYMQLSFDIASRFDIPIIVAGWTKGQSLEEGEYGKEYRPISEATADFIKNYLHKDSQHKNFPLNMEEARRKIYKKFKGITVSPHWYVPWNIGDLKEILQNKLNWKTPKLSYPADSTNCLMNFASVYLSMKYYGYTHYHIEMSKLIRKGEMTREDALKILEINFDKSLVNKILDKINCKIE